MRRAERGLTLLEVLGAVALLGILYTVLAGSAIEGLRSEGESRRRLRASLLADERLAEVELSLQAGAAPPVGSASEEQEGFTVVTEVRAFEPPPPRPEARRPAGESHSLAARHAEAQQKKADVPSLFAKPASPTAPTPLRTIDVVVRWEEGREEREIRRTTYALDADAVSEVFASVAELQSQKSEAEPKDAEAGGPKKRTDNPDQPLPDFDIPELDPKRGGR